MFLRLFTQRTTVAQQRDPPGVIGADAQTVAIPERPDFGIVSITVHMLSARLGAAEFPQRATGFGRLLRKRGADAVGYLVEIVRVESLGDFRYNLFGRLLV